MRTQIALFLLLLSFSALKSQTSIKDIQYVNDGLEKHRLDIYIPANASATMPLVVFIHGGGWSGGQKGSSSGWVKALLNSGYVCADINYRLSRDSVWPARCTTVKRLYVILKPMLICILLIPAVLV